jgi:hypothetical protein
LAPILEKLNYVDLELQEDQAIEVKNEALKKLKERLLTRAEIIQRRLEAETKTLEAALVNICIIQGKSKEKRRERHK